MRKNYNHAIVGCGRIAQNHYNAAKDNDMNVVACCDLDLEKAKKFAEKNNINYYTNDYKDILNNEIVDSVSICTDHKSHVEIAKDFLNKKNIIIEKPLCSNLKEAQKFALAAQESTKVVTIISQHRFDDVVNLIKDMLSDNVFGDITLVNASLICSRDESYYADSYWRGTKKLEGGSTIINQSFHMVDTLNYLFGLPINTKTYRKNIKFQNIIDTEDTSVSIIDYQKFLCTIISTNTSIQEWKTSIKIVGTKGDVEFNIDFPEEILEINTINELGKNYKDRLEKIKINYNNNLNNPANYYGLSHIKQFKNFKDSMNKSEMNKVTVEIALSTQKFIDMIYRR